MATIGCISKLHRVYYTPYQGAFLIKHTHTHTHTLYLVASNSPLAPGPVTSLRVIARGVLRRTEWRDKCGIRCKVNQGQMNNQDLVDFADQLIGKTVQQQAAAGNADGWMSSAMFKTVRSIFDLQKIVAFSAANVTAEMDDNLQKAYEKFRAYVANPVAGPSDLIQNRSSRSWRK